MSDTSGLGADCGECSGLCCVALPFGRSHDFAVAKPSGIPCLNLAEDFRCGIHARLRPSGWPGCTVFDCFGAGQLVTRHTFGGRTWRTDPELARQIFATFEAMRRVQEIRYYLSTLHDLPLSAGLRTDLASVAALAEDLAGRSAAVAAAADPVAFPEAGDAVPVSTEAVQALHERVSPLLRAASRELRDPAVRQGSASPIPARLRRRLRPGADLIGADLSGLDLTGADLRGAFLVAADLRRSVLDRVDLLGVDLRDANVAGADLRQSLFLTQPQLAAARGDGKTAIPPRLAVPEHWV